MSALEAGATLPAVILIPNRPSTLVLLLRPGAGGRIFVWWP